MNRTAILAAAFLAASLVNVAQAQTAQVVLVEDKGGNTAAANPLPCGGCDGCSHGHGCCKVEWLKPWKCEDLERKPVEPSPKLCGCSCLHSLLYCPPAEEKKEEDKKENGNGEKKNGENGNGQAKNGAAKDEPKNGEQEKKDEPKADDKGSREEEEPVTLTPLMQLIQCHHPGLYAHMDCTKTKLFGWIQQGYTANFDAPQNSLNFGVNYNNRANAYQLNQTYLALEKALEGGDAYNWGYRVDFLAGTDAPLIVSNGLFDHMVNADDVGEDIGLDLPQFFVSLHTPWFTKRGFDISVGKFYTYMGFEVIPAIATDFYSHSYEAFYGVPFSHTGLMTNLHVADTVDLINCLVRGWDQFDDNNDALTYHGCMTWNACDKRTSLAVAWIIGPENINNESDLRFTATAYLTRRFGCYDEWRFVTGGNYSHENNLIETDTGFQDAQWYGYTSYLFYTVNPRLILGTRAEWFADPQGVRTGIDNNYYELTLGFTCKPYQNLRIRPEFRMDWANENPAYNNFTEKNQQTLAVDLIWEF